VTANATTTTLCAGQSVTLTGSGATTYTWDNGVTNGVAFTPATTATYTVTGTDANGCTNTDQVTVTVNPLPVIDSVNVTDVLCAGDATGQINIYANGGANLLYALDGGTPQSSPSFINLSDATYLVEVTNNGCTVTQTVTINTISSISYTYNFQIPICTTPGYISLNILGGASPYIVDWPQNNLIGDSISINNAGMFIFNITDVNGCSYQDTITTVSPGDPQLSVDLEVNNISCIGLSDGSAEVIDVIGGVAPYLYQWDNGSTSTTIKDLSENIYQVTVTDQNGCIGTATAIISVDNNDCLDIHNAISPNGDGQNDVWEITGIQGKTNSTVKVFNRWGALVFESDNYQNDWRGTYKGKDLPAGIYFYIVTVDGDNFEGSLTIIR
ncbi:MAG TPA: T9SS type B sorting domain-containing protein, partial [Crocinitomix sp.]|nr:T9SS type B sorting domain-containing protein [Crocinitomix sp.]